jgi:hypothetical protein
VKNRGRFTWEGGGLRGVSFMFQRVFTHISLWNISQVTVRNRGRRIHLIEVAPVVRKARRLIANRVVGACGHDQDVTRLHH